MAASSSAVYFFSFLIIRFAPAPPHLLSLPLTCGVIDNTAPALPGHQRSNLFSCCCFVLRTISLVTRTPTPLLHLSAHFII